MKVTAIVPSYKPDEKLAGVLRDLTAAGFERIIVVDDGSGPDYEAYFRQAEGYPQCVLLRHEVNRGKGGALKTAFAWFLEHTGEDLGVVTVDGDNQHHIDDIVACARRLEEQPDTLVLGCRDFSGPEVPARSRFGNRSASFLFKTLVGLSLSDTQTGLRAIPARWVYAFADLYGERFEYETNMLLEIPRLSIPMAEQKIRTIYLDENTGSHFRPVQDTLKICRLLVKFLLSSVASFGVDILLFWLLGLLLRPVELATRLLIATAGARILSSLVNFTLNRKAVFGDENQLGGSLLRYYLLCVAQAAASYGGVYLLSRLTGEQYATPWKIAVDLLLFLVSFQIQREWVFGKRKQGGSR